METTQNKTETTIVTNELVSFFDLLARFDFEDQKKSEDELQQTGEEHCDQGTTVKTNSH